MKSTQQSWCEYACQQLMLIDSTGPSDERFGVVARQILQRLRRQIDAECSAEQPAIDAPPERPAIEAIAEKVNP